MFGMARDLGRKKQERRKSSNRLPKGAYSLDKRLVPRVKEYLNQFRKGHQPDIEELVNHLQARYSEYSRRKRRAFKLSVEKVYDAIFKEREEDKHLQELEERFLQKRKNSPDFRDLNNDDDSDDEKGSDDKGLELSSDSELSLEDEPLMEIQDTNMMNQSMQSMYKATSSRQTSEDEGEADCSKSIEKKADTLSPEGGSLHIDQNHLASSSTLCQNEERSLNMMGSSGEPQLSTQDNKSQNNPGLLSNKISNLSGKRKRLSDGEGKRAGTTPKKSRKSLEKNTKEKEKQPADPEFEPAQSSVKFSDIGGCDDTVEQVCKLLVHMKHPEVFRTLGVTPPRGFLLHGPPGCGKTLLAHAIAGELEMPFIKLAATEIVSGVSGESEQKVRELFSRAVAHAPCVVFLDEIDSITPKRETASKDMERRIVSQLLTCMDDLNSNPDAHVLVIGATNRPDSLDPALRRAGRFDREISMGIPDEKARERILRVLCQKLRLEDEFPFAMLARLTPGFVGADLMSLTREAALIAVNRIFQELERNSQNTCANEEVVNQTSEQTESCDDTKEHLNRVPRSFSVVEWLKDQSPLTEDELQKLCISMDDFKAALLIVQPSAKREGFATIPGVTWEDVGALKDVREELTMAILAPVKYPEEFQAFGLTHPPGILLAGPPGCGKTLLAKAIANESGINFISVKGPELLNMYVGESERAVRQVFQRARNSAPCVIFFDELDALCPRRSDSAESSVSVRVVNQVLTEMDGLEARKQVFIMGATNRPDIIDPAVLRPGRLDKVLFVGLPNTEDREDILRTLTKDGKKPVLLPDVSIKDLARDEKCEGLSGADLAALVREACMAALRECINVRSTCHVSIENQLPLEQSPLGVGQRHFSAAFQKVKPSVSKKDQALYGKMTTLTPT
ncbi:nuclear valosin-containing protein-like [Oculina patagonica]